MAIYTGIRLIIHFILCCSFLAGSAAAPTSDSFTEELFIKPLDKGFIYSHFQFTTKWNASLEDPQTFQHYRLFPKALGEILLRYGVRELHLSQTQGLWRHKQWGFPVHDAPPGAELWVWFKPSVLNIDEAWMGLANAVSGLFCSSLNFLDSKNTISPRWSFKPEGIAAQGYAYRSHFMRYGTLPREIVCTENLTPWKKLLPCDSNAGVSTLFNAFHFHDANYHSLGLHVRPICADPTCAEEAIELSQSLSIVTDVVGTSHAGSPNWSLKRLFGNHLVSSCPVADKSLILVETTNDQDASLYNLSPEPSRRDTVMRGDQQHDYAVFDVKVFTQKNRALNVAGAHNDASKLQEDSVPPPIHAHRYITGYGLSDGGVSCLIHSSLSENQTILYMDMMPWFTRVYFSSLEVTNNGHKVPFRVHYVPARDRVRPYQLELSFALWPHSTTRVSFTFTRAFLKWTEYPPDANHGFYVSSAVISAMLPTSQGHTASPRETSVLSEIFEDTSSTFMTRIHTESLLVSLPTPDFSMPYNVICLACTVLAIAFGSLHNLTTRRFMKEDSSTSKSPIQKVKSFLMRLRGSKSNDSPQDETKTPGSNEHTEKIGSEEESQDKKEAEDDSVEKEQEQQN